MAGILIFFTLINFIVYSPIINNYFISDETMWFKRVIYFSWGDFLKQSEFRFIIFLYFKITYSLFKFNYIYYHILQLLIHSLNAYLIFIIAYNFIFSKNSRVAIYAALFFCVSYPKYEAVMWINGINDILCTTFCLLSFIYFLKNKNFYFLIFLILAVFTKPTALIMPVILLLATLLLQSPASLLKNKNVLISFTILIFLALIYLIFFRKIPAISLIKIFTFTLFYFSELLLSFVGIGYYPMLRWPYIAYSYILFLIILSFISILFFILLKALMILVRSKTIEVTTTIKTFTFLILATIISIFLTTKTQSDDVLINFIPISRYQYLPSVWFSFLVTLLIVAIKKIISNKTNKLSFIYLIILFLPVFLNINLTFKTGKCMQPFSNITKYLTFKALHSYDEGAKKVYFLNLPYRMEKFYSPQLKDLVYIITDNKLQVILSNKIPQTIEKNTKIFLYYNDTLKPLN